MAVENWNSLQWTRWDNLQWTRENVIKEKQAIDRDIIKLTARKILIFQEFRRVLKRHQLLKRLRAKQFLENYHCKLAGRLEKRLHSSNGQSIKNDERENAICNEIWERLSKL